jgi:hypothetical protein
MAVDLFLAEGTARRYLHRLSDTKMNGTRGWRGGVRGWRQAGIGRSGQLGRGSWPTTLRFNRLRGSNRGLDVVLVDAHLTVFEVCGSCARSGRLLHDCLVTGFDEVLAVAG